MKSPIGNSVPRMVKEIPVKSGLPTNKRNQGIEEVLDQCRDDSAECGANHHADRQINDVAAQDELLETG
jgi:hypothetical protein